MINLWKELQSLVQILKKKKLNIILNKTKSSFKSKSDLKLPILWTIFMESSQKYLTKDIELGQLTNRVRNQNDLLFQEMSGLLI